jgi:MoxR-like ATPase
MEEGQVTVNGETHELPSPNVIIATQNPGAQSDGVNTVIEAATDRFFASINLKEHDKEKMLAVHKLLEMNNRPQQSIESSRQMHVIEAMGRVAISEDILSKSADIVVSMRAHKAIDPEQTLLAGQRPLASIIKGARLAALGRGENARQHVNIDDVKFVAPYILRHRIGLSYEAEEQTTKDEVIAEAISRVA